MAAHSPQPSSPAAPAPPSMRGRPLPAEVYHQLRHNGLTHEQILDVCMAVEDGVKDLRTYLGITEGVLAALEHAALQFYRQGLFMYASLQYTFIVDIDGERASGWRGLGASLLALGQAERAVLALFTAFWRAPEDLVSLFLLGEALVAARLGAEAQRTLSKALALAGDAPALAPYARRARALLASRDLSQLAPDPAAQAATQEPGTPGDARAGASNASDAHTDLGATDRLPTPEEAAKMTAADIERHPATRALLARLVENVERNVVTLKDIAGMTEEQMVGSYNAGCGFLDSNQPLKALRIACWLTYYDGTNPLFYRLAGVAAQQMQFWCLADYMLGLSLVYAPGDPISEIYRGEVKLRSQEREQGLALIRGALPKLGSDPFALALAARGRAILKSESSAQGAAK